ACAPRGLQEAVQSMDQYEYAAAISRELRGLLGERRYANWFRKSTRLQVADTELCVFAGSPYLQSWMQRQFRDVLLQAARAVLGNGARVRFEVDASLAVPDESKTGTDTAAPHQKPSASTSPARNGQAAPGRRKFAALEDFVASPANELALTAARQVADNPGGPLNP